MPSGMHRKLLRKTDVEICKLLEDIEKARQVVSADWQVPTTWPGWYTFIWRCVSCLSHMYVRGRRRSIVERLAAASKRGLSKCARRHRTTHDGDATVAESNCKCCAECTSKETRTGVWTRACVGEGPPRPPGLEGATRENCGTSMRQRSGSAPYCGSPCKNSPLHANWFGPRARGESCVSNNTLCILSALWYKQSRAMPIPKGISWLRTLPGRPISVSLCDWRWAFQVKVLQTIARLLQSHFCWLVSAVGRKNDSKVMHK
jgi:hypothetical protein